MAVKVELENERTGERKSIKVGFSWTTLFFTQVFGLPLFLRRLYQPALGAVVLCAVSWVMADYADFDHPTLTDPATRTYLGVNLMLLILSVGYGIKGNEVAAKKMLDNGWAFANPDDRSTEYAKEKWSLA